MTGNRVRVVAWRVQPVVMADDGENLTPINVQAVEIPAAEWGAFKAGGDDEALASIREQISAPDA